MEQRLHEQDSVSADLAAQLASLALTVQDLREVNEDLQHKASKAEQEDARLRMINEILRLRGHNATLATQKQELFKVLRDLHQLLKSIAP